MSEPEGGFADIRDLFAKMPKPRLITLKCHRSVLEELSRISVPAWPSPGLISDLTGIPVIVDSEMASGEWKLLEDDETIIDSGMLKQPSLTMSVPGLTDEQVDAFRTAWRSITGEHDA